MKATRLFTLLAGTSLLFSASAIAGNGKKTIHFERSVTLEGTTLPAGDYKFEWTGTGPDVKVNVIKGKETVASVSAHIVPTNVSYKQDGYSSTAGKDGSAAVSTIFFSGDKFDLELGDVSASKTTPATTASGTN